MQKKFNNKQQDFVVKKNVGEKQNNPQKVQRNSNIELLRFILATFVILYHLFLSTIKTDNWYYINIYPIVLTPVVLFIFITGFFSAKSEKSRISKVLILIIYYFLLNFIICSIINKQLLTISHFLLINNMSWRWTTWWYIWTVPVIVLFSPIINIAFKKINKWYSLVCTFLIYYIYYVYSWIDYIHIFAPGQTLLFLSIYMLGAWVSIHCKQFLNKKSLWVGSLITLILIQILNNILFAAGLKTVYTFMPISTDVGKDITQPLVVLTAVLIFIIFYNIKIKYNFFINFLGKISLLIYLFHALFLVITLKYIMPHFFNNNDSVLALLTWFGFTFLFSFTFSTLVVYPVNYLIDKTYLVFIYCKNKLLTICNNKIESFKNKKNEKNQLKINE